jgi:hypothetical protein
VPDRHGSSDAVIGAVDHQDVSASLVTTTFTEGTRLLGAGVLEALQKNDTWPQAPSLLTFTN